MADSKTWRCEWCDKAIGAVMRDGLDCDFSAGLKVRVVALAIHVQCACGKWNIWVPEKTLLREALGLDSDPDL